MTLGGVASYVLVLMVLSPFGFAQTGSLGRYGHAATYLVSPPTLLLYGGKSDPSNAYSYTSAPNTNTMLVLPLDQPFQSSSPPVREVPTDAPSYAWHCLVPSDRDNELLSFGGDGGPALAVQTNNDSSWLLRPQVDQKRITNVSASQQAISWAQQPTRRVHHSCAGRFLTGGLRNDGSGVAYDDVYAYTGTSFKPLPSLPNSLYHHTSVLLPNGTLLVMGGVTNDNGQVKLAALDTLWSLDTTSPQSAWTSIVLAGAVPTPRRGSTASLNTAGDAAVLIGGTSLDLSQPLAESWRLDLAELKWTKVADSVVARFDHVAISAGDDQVLLFGGYGSSGQVDDRLEIFSFSSDSFVDGFTPRPLDQPQDQHPSGAGDPTGQGSGETSSSGSPSPNSSDGTQNVGDEDEDAPDENNPSPLPSNPPEPSDQASLTLPIALGTILGLLACAAAGLGILWYRRKMRRRRQGPSTRPASKREYAPDSEKDGQGLLLQRPHPTARIKLAPGPQPQTAVPMIHRHLRSVKRVLSSGSRTTRRFDMLVDEDSRLFEDSRGENEHWKSAASLLGSEQDEEEESWESPALRGGPVPTPRLSSLASQNPFDDPTVVETPSTEPPSLNSRRSLSTTGEPATIHTASVITRTFVPIKRTETFLNRLTGVFLGTPTASSERIRDPTPAPSLWPLDSLNLFGETPSLELPFVFRPGQSVSSLATAQSYRDMEIVQRERTRTETTDEEGDLGMAVAVGNDKEEENALPLGTEDTDTIKQVIINDFAVPLRHITPPPTGQPSPAATPSPRHVRRPVREVVASINKRAPPRTTYEAVRKSALVVTNPDGHARSA